MDVQTIVLAKRQVANTRTGFRNLSLVWLNEGTSKDVELAREYAAEEDYTVFLYPVTEQHPIERGRLEISQLHEILDVE